MKAVPFSHLFRLALALVCGSPALLLADGPPAKSGIRILKDIPYVTHGHFRQKLDLYLPEKPKGPLLVGIHGGGWRGGSKEPAQGLQMLTQGYAVASVEYRFSQDAIFPAQIEDCKAAIRWLRAHAAEYGYDPQKIAAWGGSAGGHLTALLATTGNTKEFDVGEHLDQSSAIQCGVDLFGPTDFPGWEAPNGNSVVDRNSPKSLIVLLLGGTIDDKLELAKKASPLVWASKESAPLMILHGTADPLVALNQSERLTDKYKSLGVEVILDVVQNGGHGGPEFAKEDRPVKILQFLNQHLLKP